MKRGGAALLPPLSLWSARVVFTGRAEGDMGHSGDPVVTTLPDGVQVAVVRPDVAARRRAVVDFPWTWLRQVHGARVARVEGPGGSAGAVADAAVTDRPGCALAVLTADCAPVALASPEGVIGVAHAGWRGLRAGVVEETVAQMRAMGATTLTAVIGPCIRPECYEFGSAELDEVAAQLGDGVRSATADGRPALDLPAAVRAALERACVDPGDDVTDVGVCTACSDGHFSWRARREQQRQATVIWR